MKEETDFDANDRSQSENARHERWLTLMAKNRGKIDVAAAQKFLGDHYDSYEGKNGSNERTLCGHIETSPRGMGTWQPPYAPAGRCRTRSRMRRSRRRCRMTAALGHACGGFFQGAEHLAKHPEFGWQREILKDMDARGWTRFGGK